MVQVEALTAVIMVFVSGGDKTQLEHSKIISFLLTKEILVLNECVSLYSRRSV